MMATLIKRELLSANKKTYLLTFRSSASYTPGDSVIINPKNDPELIRKTGFPILEAHNLSKPSAALIRYVYDKKGLTLSDDLLLQESTNHEVWDFLEKHEIVLNEDLFPLLPKLSPRFYSICSSSKKHPGEFRLLVTLATHTSSNILRKGPASSYLCERLKLNETIPVQIHSPKYFHLPQEDRDIIMIGPGTGLAPFISFLEEREMLKCSGRNWLFFGEQHLSSDFYFQDYLLNLKNLKLTTAFSRDQQEKVYVHHRIDQNSKEIYSWVKNGAYIYLCGNRDKVGKDAEKTLLSVLREDYLTKLRAENRYLKEVY